MALHRTKLLLSLANNHRQYSALSTQYKQNKLLDCYEHCQVLSGRSLMWEKERKAGYNTKLKVPLLKQLKDGFKELKSEVVLFSQEIKEIILMDPILFARPNETDLLWCFDKSSELEKFVATCDSDHNEGFSRCNFDMSPSGRALFHGHLDTRVPKDGRIKKAGYCAIRSKRVRKSFKREGTFNWDIYNTLVMKVRGDGRSYLLNMSCEGYYDITWNDIYHYVLYTRGGPYWQIAKIPFSKFILGSKGRVQDKQTRVRTDRVTHFGISCGDKIDGRFNLEIEYIGLEFDPTHSEEFAYEMYKTERYIVGV